MTNDEIRSYVKINSERLAARLVELSKEFDGLSAHDNYNTSHDVDDGEAYIQLTNEAYIQITIEIAKELGFAEPQRDDDLDELYDIVEDIL